MRRGIWRFKPAQPFEAAGGGRSAAAGRQLAAGSARQRQAGRRLLGTHTATGSLAASQRERQPQEEPTAALRWRHPPLRRRAAPQISRFASARSCCPWLPGRLSHRPSRTPSPGCCPVPTHLQGAQAGAGVDPTGGREGGRLAAGLAARGAQPLAGTLKETSTRCPQHQSTNHPWLQEDQQPPATPAAPPALVEHTLRRLPRCTIILHKLEDAL